MMPFSLGHARLLFAARSPLVEAANRPVQFDDVLTAAYLCAMPWEAAASVVMDAARVERECRRWGRTARQADIMPQSAALVSYVRESTAIPQAFRREGAKPRDAGLPWPWLVAWAVKARTTDPWCLPCVEALSWYCCACAEAGIEFLSEEQIDAANGVVVTKDSEASNATQN